AQGHRQSQGGPGLTAALDIRQAIREQVEQSFPDSARPALELVGGNGPWLKPYVYRDPSLIPRRQWLYGGHYIRTFTSATFAPGGVGKSVLCMTEAVCMALGRPLLGLNP